jgi:hypothetical protein
VTVTLELGLMTRMRGRDISNPWLFLGSSLQRSYALRLIA